MPTVIDLMAELADTGITISDQTALRNTEASDHAWQAAFMELVQTGRKHGVRFTRSSPRAPTDDQLHQIMRGYGFSSAQIQQFIGNLVSE